MKTNLLAKSNALLTEEDSDAVAIAIISCGKKEDITKKIEKAIRDHYVATKVEIDTTEDLTNQARIFFVANFLDKGEECVRDFCIEVLATY